MQIQLFQYFYEQYRSHYETYVNNYFIRHDFISTVLDFNIRKQHSSNKILNEANLYYDKNEDIYRYNLAFKILNSLLYLDKNDNIFKEIFDYSSSYVKNEKTFEERLSINIGDIHNTNNKIEIEYIKSKLINNLTYLNYINLNEVSPFYFKKYFNNIYIIIDNKIFYIKDIINNDIINKLVKDKLLKSGETEENIDGINYIKFLNDNKNLIFKLKHMKGKIIDPLSQLIQMRELLIDFKIFYFI